MAEEEHVKPRFVPQNATDTGKTLAGLVRTRNLIEACAISAPIGIILFFGIPKSVLGYEITGNIKIMIMTFVIGAIFLLFIYGVPPYSRLEYMMLRILFKKKKHYAKYNPRLKWEKRPEYLIDKDANSPMTKFAIAMSNLLLGNTKFETLEEDKSIAEGIRKNTFNERFRDDPDTAAEKARLDKENQARVKEIKERNKKRLKKLKKGEK